MGDESGLWLIGLGPGGADRLTEQAVKAAQQADYRFLEGYTALLAPVTLSSLEEKLGTWQLLMRSGVEEPVELLSLATKSKVALLVVGDPLQATTHVDLQLRCEAENIPCHIIHGVSITTIVTGAVGLQSYRFGRQATFAYPFGDYLPTSPLEIILSNKKSNLHSLVLLDLDPSGNGEGEQSPMTPTIAIDVLRRMLEKLANDPGGNTNSTMLEEIEHWKIALCSDMGTAEECIRVGTPSQVALMQGGRIHCLVIPATLHEMEAQALARWSQGS